MRFDNTPSADGKIRVGVWDRFTTWGEKAKDGQESRFDEQTLPQMVRNWKSRGDMLAMDANHQSSYASQNGQPAPALAWYSALAVIRNHELLCFEAVASGVQPPQPMQLSDGLWGYRAEVTEMGEILLPNFKYLSPTFTTSGLDEQGNPIGYVIHAVAATNTPFQSGTGITFESIKENNAMATKYEMQVMAKLGLDAGADDEKVKAAYARKMEEARDCMESGEPSLMKKMAEDLEELAGHHAAAFSDDASGMADRMRGMASRLSKLSKLDEAPAAAPEEPMMEEEHKEEPAQMESRLRRDYSALAGRLGVRLPDGATSKQMFDAISAATVPAAQIPALVDARVKQMMFERDQLQAKKEAADKARVLVDAAVAGGYPAEQRAALLNFASDPKSYAAAEAMVKPFLKTSDSSILFAQMTAAGSPVGAEQRREGTNVNSARDSRRVDNSLGSFRVDGERFATKAAEWADAKDGTIKMEIDAMLSDTERGHGGYRLIAANRLLRKKHPEMWAAAEEFEG